MPYDHQRLGYEWGLKPAHAQSLAEPACQRDRDAE
jgi:hypothetical protein